MNEPMLCASPTTLKDRLRAARKSARLTVTRAGEALGISAGAITQWETGQTVPASSRLTAIARVYSVDVGWLLTGAALDERPRSDSIQAREQSGGHTVPIYDWNEAAGLASPMRTPSRMHTVSDCSDISFALAIQDNSNVSAHGLSYDIGDHVVIDPALDARPGDMVLVSVDESSPPLLRRYRPKFPDGATFSPLSADWPTVDLPSASSFRLIGPVVEVTKVIRRPL